MKKLRRFWLVCLIALLCVSTTVAFHAPPWDTGHQSFSGDPGDTGTDPGTGDGCNSCPCAAKAMSPVEAATGNFIYSRRLLMVSGLGPAFDLTLTYNSQDRRRGSLGVGWVHPYEQRVIETTDGANIFAICSQADGKRERFTKNPDGSYSAPPHVFATLRKNPDNTFDLQDKYGMVRRFNAQGLLAAIVDRNGNNLRFIYDSTGFMTQATDATGRTVTLTKGADGRIESVADPGGRLFRLAYDASGNLLRFTDPLGNNTTYQYDSVSNLTAIVDPRGNTLARVMYDSSGRVSQHIEGDETWTYTYSPASKRTTKRDSLSRTWIFDYNDNGNVTKTVDPFGKMEIYVVDAKLNVTQFTDKNGHTTKYTYDAVGNQLTITDSLNRVRVTTYESVFNQPLTVQDASGNRTRFEYDSRGNLTKTVDALGNATQFQYDAKGQLTGIVDPLGNSTTLTFNTQGNIIQTADPLENTSRATFDGLGKILTATDAEGRVAQFVYDDNERLVRSVNAMGGVTLSDYDAFGNLSALTTPGGAKTTYQYDALNRLRSVTNPVGQGTSFTYDRRNNLASKTNANGQTITYTYDALDRLTRKTRVGDEVIYSYDAVGNLLTISDGDSSLSFVYDDLDRVTEARTAATAGQLSTTIRYAYDADGNRKTLTNPAGGVANYAYDALHRTTSLTDPTGQTFTFTYDGLSRRTKVDRPLGLTATYTYDAAGRLTSLVHQGGPRTVPINYTLDRVGSRLTKTDNTGSISYNYDLLTRLTATLPSVGVPAESYSYEAGGNRTTSHLSATHSHNAANRLTADATFDYSYDPNGNLIKKTERATAKVTNYTFDAENQLTQIVFPDGTSAAYRYDGLGRRIEKNLNGQITRYIYDDENILFEYAGTGLAASYTHGPGTDDVLSVTRNGSTSFFQSDPLGSVAAVVNASGTLASYTYDSFGRITAQTGTRQAPYGFHGREFDSESGLYYFRARYYDSQAGRFLSEDPVGIDGGPNAYVFTHNNPINFRDPSGEIAFVPIILGAWAVLELAASAYDIYDAVNTALNPCESLENKAIGIAGAGLGIVGPGGGYGTAGKAGIRGISGYTRHGLNQAISRDGVGVSPRAILDAVRSPTKIIEQGGGKTKFIGRDATVVLNADGKVITTHANSGQGIRVRR